MYWDRNYLKKIGNFVMLLSIHWLRDPFRPLRFQIVAIFLCFLYWFVPQSFALKSFLRVFFQISITQALLFGYHASLSNIHVLGLPPTRGYWLRCVGFVSLSLEIALKFVVFQNCFPLVWRLSSSLPSPMNAENLPCPNITLDNHFLNLFISSKSLSLPLT